MGKRNTLCRARRIVEETTVWTLRTKNQFCRADRRRLADDGTLSVGRIMRVRSSLKDLTPAMTELPDKNMAADFSADMAARRWTIRRHIQEEGPDRQGPFPHFILTLGSRDQIRKFPRSSINEATSFGAASRITPSSRPSKMPAFSNNGRAAAV
jgi:hypothetical protein